VLGILRILTQDPAFLSTLLVFSTMNVPAISSTETKCKTYIFLHQNVLYLVSIQVVYTILFMI